MAGVPNLLPLVGIVVSLHFADRCPWEYVQLYSGRWSTCGVRCFPRVEGSAYAVVEILVRSGVVSSERLGVGGVRTFGKVLEDIVVVVRRGDTVVELVGDHDAFVKNFDCISAGGGGRISDMLGTEGCLP